jgi:hypothetical protein
MRPVGERHAGEEREERLRLVLARPHGTLRLALGLAAVALIVALVVLLLGTPS